MKFIITTCLFMLIIIAPGVHAGSPDEAVAQAWELIDQGALVIDVRSAEEFDEGHLEGALNIPHTDHESLLEAARNNPDRELVLYCRSGNRSGKALEFLQSQGVTRAHNGMGYSALNQARPDSG